MDHSKYLQETPFIDISSQTLREQTQKLVTEIIDPREQIKAIFFFVRDEIKYNPYTSFFHPEDYTASKVLKRGEGFCIPKASLFTAMMRILKIPAKLYFADIKNYKAPKKLTDIMGNLFIFHCYCGVWIDDRWIKLAPTFNRDMFTKIGVEANDFDGFHDAILPATNLNGEVFVEYVKDRGENHDIPYKEIIAAFSHSYDKEVIKKLGLSTFQDCRP